MTLYDDQDTANPHAGRQTYMDSPPEHGTTDDEFGRWLEAQSALFRGKRPSAQMPALLNGAMLNT